MRQSDFVFRYRVRNWPEYNRALVRRGSLTLWVDEQAVSGWCDASGSSARGGWPRTYTDTAIECALVVKAVFHLSLRATHLGVDETTKEIVAVDLTTSQIHDSHQLPDLLNQTPDNVAQVSGDKAYDCRGCYESILERGAEPTIPPRRRARLSRDVDPPPQKAARDRVLHRIAAHGRYNWRVTSGATRQSLAENAISRFKALVGVKLTARTFENQRIEALGELCNNAH